MPRCPATCLPTALALALLGAILAGCRQEKPATPDDAPPSSPLEPQVASGLPPGVTEGKIQELVDQQDQLDSALYLPEVQAQDFGQTFVLLWDRLRRGDPWEALSKFHFDSILAPPFSGWQNLDLGLPGMQQGKLEGVVEELTHADYLAKIQDFSAQGWEVVQTEWHHIAFRPLRDDYEWCCGLIPDPGNAGEEDGDPPATSIFSFEIHARQDSQERRIQIKGDLRIVWTNFKTWDKTPYPGSIEIRDCTLLEQVGPPLFKKALEFDPLKEGKEGATQVGPVLVYDLLGHDGLPEIVLAGSNLLFKNLGDGEFGQTVFLPGEGVLPLQGAAIFADVNGDGNPDFLSSTAREKKLRFWPGSEDGSFSEFSRIAFDVVLEQPQALSAGDIDGDGDLDLYLGQWRQIYDKGSMPTPYYDALDGHPDFLLLNDGEGNFADATEGTPMETLRRHRTHSASFADLDGDGRLDLLTVSDFSGLDVFRNEGGGEFADVTADWIPERYAFGMSHVLDDFNGDGQTDLFMAGKNAATVGRLEGLGISREDFEVAEAMRMAMAYGNRLYLGRDGEFDVPDYRGQVARTGWSWGSGSADFDNDGDSDLYIANGYLSGSSAKDYSTRFWCHDLYVGTSEPDPLLHTFYSLVLGKSGWDVGKKVSWGGYSKNHLFLNDNGQGFRNAGFLAGAAFGFDARSVVTADLDMDGKMDLLVTRYNPATHSNALHVFLNQSRMKRNWIGVRFLDTPGLQVPGVTVTAKKSGRVWHRQIVNGDSYASQHPAQVHFGLGELENLDSLEIRWQNGQTQTIQSPQLNQYHLAAP